MPRKLDLRTGKPVWFAYRAPRVPAARLARDARCDVLVVGMGISGALIADALAEAGLSVIAIDRRGPLKGSTSATTALVQYELDQPLSRLVRQVGKERAVAAWRRSRLGVANLAGRVRGLDVDCHLAERPSLYLAGDELDVDALAEEAEARRAAGLAARFLDRRALRDGYGIGREAAILSPGNLTLDPRRLTAAALLRAMSNGAKLHAPAEAFRIAHSASEVTVETRDGPTIRAGHVVLATGYELMDAVPRVPHSIVSTWAIATRPRQPGWPDDALVWEASDPYLYLRRTRDGRIICGGEDEPFSDEEARDALIGEKTALIARKLHRLLPTVDPTPAFAWTGSFGTTSTGMPYIGRIPHRPRLFAVMGYGGNGITFSQIASEMVCNLIEGRGDADAALFGFG